MRFLHLSDIHFLRNYPKAEDGYNAIFNNMTSPLIQLKRCLSRVDINEIDFIIITGDLVEGGNWQDYKVLKENINDLFGEIPYIVTLGNHDNKEAFYKGWLGKDINDEVYNDVREFNDLVVVSLDNSQFNNSQGVISEGQKVWLREQLVKYQDRDILLMVHHHLLENQFVTPAVDVDDEFKAIVRESSIVAVFTGHTHHPYSGVFEGKPYYTARSLSFVGINEDDGNVRFEEGAGFNLCEYTNGQITVNSIEAIEDARILGNVRF